MFLYDYHMVYDGHGFTISNEHDRMIGFITSSTAQGGGGSFKYRKPIDPIGEVGCCESRIAERIH